MREGGREREIDGERISVYLGFLRRYWGSTRVGSEVFDGLRQVTGKRHRGSKRTMEQDLENRQAGDNSTVYF